MGLFGNMFYGASSASLWTGNMIYTALQNAKTKKEAIQIERKMWAELEDGLNLGEASASFADSFQK